MKKNAHMLQEVMIAMGMMKVIIDIPEEEYNIIKSLVRLWFGRSV